jgi:hypothetical protein
MSANTLPLLFVTLIFFIARSPDSLARLLSIWATLCRHPGEGGPDVVIASGAKQSIFLRNKRGLLRRFAPRNDGGYGNASLPHRHPLPVVSKRSPDERSDIPDFHLR